MILVENLTIEPYGDLVLVEREQEADTTKGGIVIPEQAKDKDENLPTWEVKAVGPGRANTSGTISPVRVKVGDRVLVAPSRGNAFPIPTPGPKRLLVTEATIIGIVQGAA